MNICLLTPSYAGDIRQFSLLRRTIERFAPDYHHLVIVHSEDYDIFNNRFGGSRNLTLIKTKDVLPSQIEARRRTSSNLFNRIKQRLCGTKIGGWHAQQLTKLFALAQCNFDAVAFIDSDVLICKPLSRDYFLDGEKVKLFRRRACNAEQFDFDISTHDIIGGSIHGITELYDYIFQPAVFKTSTAHCLLQLLKQKHGRHWCDRFLAEKRPSEFNLLGYAATTIEAPSSYSLIECNPEDIHYSIRYHGDQGCLLAQFNRFAEARDTEQQKSFFLIQSTLNVDISLLENIASRILSEAGQYGAARV